MLIVDRLLRFLVVGGLAALMAACAGTQAPSLPSGAAAYSIIPQGDVLQARDYPIGPLDVLTITVYREPDLSIEKALVDSDGNVQLPLLGAVRASGKTSGDLARLIETGFAARYLVNPHVTVSVIESSRRRVTVDGAVTQPGVYELPGRISLIDAVALAKGTTNVARESQVAIIRRIDGQRLGGVFDLARVRAGKDPDPEILAGDQIIVGTSSIRAAYRDLLQASPLLGVLNQFRPTSAQ